MAQKKLTPEGLEKLGFTPELVAAARVAHGAQFTSFWEELAARLYPESSEDNRQIPVEPLPRTV